MATTFILKRISEKSFSGIGRSGYPRGYIPEELGNDEDLPVEYIVTPLTIFVDDFGLLSKPLKNRVTALINSLKSGYIYENNPEDSEEYTHSRERANVSGYRVFSKDVDNEHRLIYGIKSIKKETINGIRTLVVRIKLIGCMGHDTDKEIKDRISGNMTMRNKRRLFSEEEE